ncbi:helix-turn-helix domain-containing protein [uncultured Clostridium sp.]|jgi:excisionase family DNA binding protein|uniref:helix-turn-helix domain-containing protein n=1 Tax=uncultured Clostridium sp. TaxID=59620 RepID=UPI00205ABBE0|nr:helix-turn-helix domain-containing protein [uncultured Clostridium sp.]DAO91516.1 MAG TPA: helix-turn-helix domain protein [Caudoviricetes sp.]
MSMPWYTTEEAAELLGLSPHSVREKLRTKEIKGSKAGKEWRIPKTEINKVLGIETEDKKDIYIKELEERNKYLTLQVETFKNIADSLVKVIS